MEKMLSEETRGNPISKVYLMPQADRTWSAVAADAPPTATAAEFVVEQDYPATLYFARTDINGSCSIEAVTCLDRCALIEALNWAGRCRYNILALWDFDGDKPLNEILAQIFDASAERRIEIMVKIAEEMSADFLLDDDDPQNGSFCAKIQNAENCAAEQRTACSSQEKTPER